MKKFLVLFLMLFVGVPTFAYELDLTKDGKMQPKINEVGFKLLNANRIDKKTVFVLRNSKSINAFAITGLGYGRTVNVNTAILPYVDSEDELAALLGHEISHVVDSYKGVLRGSFSGLNYALSSKKYEYLADKRGIDYMVNAGYNPVAMIVVMNKIASQYRFDVGTHPLTTKRLMSMYEYIYRKYPAYLANNKYQNNVYYQNFLLVSMNNRKLLQEAVKSNSKKSPKYR